MTIPTPKKSEFMPKSHVIKPLLASKVDFNILEYPVLCTPKFDGIRCVILNGQVLSRTMKLIPNNFIREELLKIRYDDGFNLDRLDGELMLRELTGSGYDDVQSAVMSVNGEPDFVYNVFDRFSEPSTAYESRIETLTDEDFVDPNRRLNIIAPEECENEFQVLALLDCYLRDGYEGLMMRYPESLYKFGRSTPSQGYLLKLKKFFDDEGTLLEVKEKMINNNPKETNELGYTKRSSNKENLVPAGTAGAMMLQWDGRPIRCGFGPGITDAIKKQWWDAKDLLKGQAFKFTYQELTKTDIPRFPKIILQRHEDDIL